MSSLQDSEMEMGELLEGALAKVHEAHLQRIDWEILDRSYEETVDKLESIEPQIICNNAMEKHMASMEDTVGKKSNSNAWERRKIYTHTQVQDMQQAPQGGMLGIGWQT